MYELAVFLNALQLPVSGERSEILPFLIGGGLVLAALGLIVVKNRRKNDDDQNDLKS